MIEKLFRIIYFTVKTKNKERYKGKGRTGKKKNRNMRKRFSRHHSNRFA